MLPVGDLPLPIPCVFMTLILAFSSDWTLLMSKKDFGAKAV